MPTHHPRTLAFAVARFGDPEHAERTVFATLHDLEAIFQTHETLEQRKTPKQHRGPPFVVSAQETQHLAAHCQCIGCRPICHDHVAYGPLREQPAGTRMSQTCWLPAAVPAAVPSQLPLLPLTCPSIAAVTHLMPLLLPPVLLLVHPAVFQQ
jgi:hypothetical protein